MSERLYRIGPFGGVALPETYDLEPGYADTEYAGAEIIQLPRRRPLFGFARAFVEAPPLPEAPAEPRFRTKITFRRLWPGERTETVETVPAVEPTWRTELRFRRAVETVEAVEPVETNTVQVLAAEIHDEEPVADEPATTHEEPEISMPSSIDPVQAAVEEPAAAEAEPEPEIVVEPEIVIPDPEAETTVAVVEEPVADEPEQKSRKRTPRVPKQRKQRRGGGSPKGNRLVGLKIGASQLAAAVVLNDEVPEVQQLARTPFESGLIVDGEVRDEDALAGAMKQFFAEAGLPTKGVRIGLASNRIGVRTLEISGVADMARFDNAVRFKAHEVLPIAMNESVLDYRVLSERPGENGEVIRRVLLVVAPREQVDPYVSAARKAGIKLHGIDLEAFALLRAFVEPHSAGAGTEQAAIVVVSIGHESTTLVVSGAGDCEFTRVFGWGGASLDAAIAAACSVTAVEANAIKTQLSLNGEPPATLDAAVAGRALEAVRTELTLFARELVSSLQFYQKQPDSLGIGEVVVTGGTTHLGGLTDSLHTLVGVPVRNGDPLARVVVARGVAADPTIADTLGSLSVAIGLGVEDDPMRAVNLLPADAQTGARRTPSRTQILIPAAIAVPVVALAALFVPAHSSVGSKQTELDSLKAELATLPAPTAAGIDQSIKGEQARRAAVVADVLSKRASWDRVLRDVSLVLPKEVWLNTVEGTVPAPLSTPVDVAAATSTAKPVPSAVAASASGLRLIGRTYSQAGVARLLARLATVPTLGNVQLTRSGKVKAGDRKVIEFEIAASLRGPGEAS
jgi:type IV pilus assembly protein PilM